MKGCARKYKGYIPVNQQERYLKQQGIKKEELLTSKVNKLMKGLSKEKREKLGLDLGLSDSWIWKVAGNKNYFRNSNYSATTCQAIILWFEENGE